MVKVLEVPRRMGAKLGRRREAPGVGGARRHRCGSGRWRFRLQDTVWFPNMNCRTFRCRCCFPDPSIRCYDLTPTITPRPGSVPVTPCTFPVARRITTCSHPAGGAR